MIHHSFNHDIDRIGITEEAVTAIQGRRLMNMHTDADRGKAAGSKGSKPAKSTGPGPQRTTVAAFMDTRPDWRLGHGLDAGPGWAAGWRTDLEEPAAHGRLGFLLLL